MFVVDDAFVGAIAIAAASDLFADDRLICVVPHNNIMQHENLILRSNKNHKCKKLFFQSGSVLREIITKHAIRVFGT